MSSVFKSSLSAFLKTADEAVDKGLIAAAQVAKNATIRSIVAHHGYTTGDFYRDGHVQWITIGDPFTKGTARVIRYGSSWPPHMFWEVGHQNLFTRRFERVEIWRPAFVDTREAQRAAFNRVFTRMAKGVTPPTLSGGLDTGSAPGEAAD